MLLPIITHAVISMYVRNESCSGKAAYSNTLPSIKLATARIFRAVRLLIVYVIFAAIKLQPLCAAWYVVISVAFECVWRCITVVMFYCVILSAL